MQVDDGNSHNLVRLFADYAGSVIWFDEPFDYEMAGISAALRSALQVWEKFYYDKVGYGSASTAQAQARFDADGRRLAQALADEIGAGFTVEYTSETRPQSSTRFVSRWPGTNPAATAAFAQQSASNLAADEEMRSTIEEIRLQGGSFGWSAFSPNTGQEFRGGQA